VRPADLATGIQVPLLHHFVRTEGARVLLPATTYVLEGDKDNPAHLLNEPRGEQSWDYESRTYLAWSNWKPEWRLGYDSLQIAAGVTLVGQEGAVLEGVHARLEVEAEGGRYESLHLPQGVLVRKGGLLTMTKCTSTGEKIQVEKGRAWS